MTLQKQKDTKDKLLDDVYGSAFSSTKLQKCKFPKEEHRPRDVYNAIHDELMLDGNSRQNLATFCTTWVEPETQKLMAESLDKNMIDKDEYPQTAEIERRAVDMIADLWNASKSENLIGCSTTGSSEAAMLGGLALKWGWRKRRQAEGKLTDKPNLVTGPVQICWHKFCRYWDVELREIPMEGDRLIMTPEEVLRRVDENTIGVIPTLGVTFTGQYEPIKDVSDALDRLQREKGLDIPMHIDAASGGFLAPFVEPDLEWDFRLPRVKSINASGHKFGMAPLGVGWVLWRDTAYLDEELIFQVNYLGGNMPTFALNFSRPGGQIISQYYTFLRLGREGYRKVQQECYDTARFLAKAIDQMDIFTIIYGGEGGIPAVTWRLEENANVGFTVYDLADRLRSRGWLVPAYSMPANRTDLVVQRIIVRHGFSRDLATLLLDDIRQSIAFFAKHPVGKPLSKAEAGSYNHNG
ncbi:MAG TPA: glutamate decarboxylase [Ruminiclostridium sp.]